MRMPTALLAAFSTALAFGGCASTAAWTSAKFHWKSPEKATRMVLMLTPSSVESAGRTVHPGMMCRAYFFSGKTAKPVQVDGKVVFTAYDRGKPDGSPPDGIYEIAPEELSKHLRQDIVGDSYVFWLPFEPAQATQVLVQGQLVYKDGTEITSSAVAVEMNPAPPPGVAEQGKRKSQIHTYKKPIRRPRTDGRADFQAVFSN